MDFYAHLRKCWRLCTYFLGISLHSTFETTMYPTSCFNLQNISNVFVLLLDKLQVYINVCFLYKLNLIYVNVAINEL